MPASLHTRARKLVERTTDIAQKFGRRAALTDLQHRVVNQVVPTTVLRGMTAVERDIDPAFFEAGGLEARWATEREALATAEDAELGRESSAAFVRGALAKGDRCFALFDDNRIVSLGWYSMKPTQLDDELVLHFDPAWAYMYKGYTLHGYRGRRLHAIGMSLALRALTREGARGLVSYVNATNFQSLRSTERMGYVAFGDVYVMRLFGRPRTWATPGCAAYQFRAERSAAA